MGQVRILFDTDMGSTTKSKMAGNNRKCIYSFVCGAYIYGSNEFQLNASAFYTTNVDTELDTNYFIHVLFHGIMS